MCENNYSSFYVGENNIKVDKFLLDDGKRHDFAIIIPGGAYNEISYINEGRDFALKMNKFGLNAFVIYYRVKEEAEYPNPLIDVVDVTKFIFLHKNEFSLTDRYHVFGSSAGGHLALMYSRSDIGYKKFDLIKPKTLVLIYPVVTLKEGSEYLTKKRILGNYKDEDFYIDLLSNESHIASDFPNTFIVAGKDDTLVDPYKNALTLKKALDEKGVNNEFHLFDKFYHGAGLGVGTDGENWIEEAYKFFNI